MHRAENPKRRRPVQWRAVAEDAATGAEGRAAAYKHGMLRLTGG